MWYCTLTGGNAAFNRGSCAFCWITAKTSGLRVPLQFILTTRTSRSSRGRLRLRRHVYGFRLARAHPRQDRHGHCLGGVDAQPVDGGPWAGDGGRGRGAVPDDCCRGAGGFGRSVPRGFLPTCSYRQRQKHSPLERRASKKKTLDEGGDDGRWQKQSKWRRGGRTVAELCELPRNAAFFCIIVTGQSLWARRSCFNCATSFLRRVTSFWPQQNTNTYFLQAVSCHIVRGENVGSVCDLQPGHDQGNQHSPSGRCSC